MCVAAQLDRQELELRVQADDQLAAAGIDGVRETIAERGRSDVDVRRPLGHETLHERTYASGSASCRASWGEPIVPPTLKEEGPTGLVPAALDR